MIESVRHQGTKDIHIVPRHLIVLFSDVFVLLLFGTSRVERFGGCVDLRLRPGFLDQRAVLRPVLGPPLLVEPPVRLGFGVLVPVVVVVVVVVVVGVGVELL